MTKDEAITQLRYSSISHDALLWLLDALKETPEQTNAPEQTNDLDPFEGAPEWARFRVADKWGKEYWFEEKPYNDTCSIWLVTVPRNIALCPDRRLTYSDWKESMVERGRP